jgi:hypothetical protein
MTPIGEVGLKGKPYKGMTAAARGGDILCGRGGVTSCAEGSWGRSRALGRDPDQDSAGRIAAGFSRLDQCLR